MKLKKYKYGYIEIRRLQEALQKDKDTHEEKLGI